MSRTRFDRIGRRIRAYLRWRRQAKAALQWLSEAPLPPGWRKAIRSPGRRWSPRWMYLTSLWMFEREEAVRGIFRRPVAGHGHEVVRR